LAFFPLPIHQSKEVSSKMFRRQNINPTKVRA
jgi:hypothetical protein